MNRLCLIIEKWAPLGAVAAMVAFTWSLCGCTISPAPIFAPAPVQVPAMASAASSPVVAPGSVPAAVGAAVAPVSKQAQVAFEASKAAGPLNFWGIVAIIVGAIFCAVPVIPNGLGFGTIFGGLICILAGILLPVYAVWIGWGLVGAVALFYLGRLNTNPKEKPLFDFNPNNLSKNA
jgi:hypothetical protein